VEGRESSVCRGSAARGEGIDAERAMRSQGAVRVGFDVESSEHTLTCIKRVSSKQLQAGVA